MRHVKKIDFEIKNVVVHNDLRRIEEYILNKGELKKKLENGIVPAEEIRASKKTYEIYEVYNPYKVPNMQYVAVDEKDLLDQLLSISRTMIVAMEIKAQEKGMMEGKVHGYKQGVHDAFIAISKLPWYKRLFKWFS